MRFWTTAKLSWFNSGATDTVLLEKWQDASLSYRLNQTRHTSKWQHHRYQQILATKATEQTFKQAADQLLRYYFYPKTLMSYTSHFSLENRWMRVGDRIVQRIHLFQALHKPVLDIVGMTEVANVWVEPHRCGFTYVTTSKHVAEGEWSAEVHWLANHDLQITVSSYSRPSVIEPRWTHSIIDRLQRHAHQQGLTNFKQTLQTAVSVSKNHAY